MKLNLRSRRRFLAASGVFSLSLSLLVASLLSPQLLLAVQDEDAAANASAESAELRVPQDISEETIDKIDAGLAAAVSPLLNTLFDRGQTVEARQAAAKELQRLAGEIAGDKPAKAELRTRLSRRVSLLEAALRAGTVENIDLPATDSAAALTASANDVAAWLGTIQHGELWLPYLHLSALQSGKPEAKTLEQVLRNLTLREGMNEDQRQFIEKPRLQSLKASVETSLALSENSYETDADSARRRLHSMLDGVVTSALAYETTQLVSDAEKVRAGYRMLRSRYPAAADAIRPEIMNHYFNHNLHFTLSESLLSRLVSDYRTESGCIADCILGAWVTGSQITNVNVMADIVASTGSASFQILANGHIQSNTTAQKSPATVFTQGNHDFSIQKPVYFSGRSVSSSAGNIDVSVNNRTLGIRTKYDGIPLIGGIVRKMAWKKVAESAPKSKALTTERISDEALPKFEDEVSSQLSEQNSTLQKTLDALDARGVGPDSISARSSNTHIAVSSRTMGVTRLGGSAQPPVLLSSNGMAIQLHESAFNNTADALGFNGRTIPEEQVITELEKGLSTLLQRDIKFGKEVEPVKTEPVKPADGEEPEPPTSFVFSRTDPIRAHFADNQIVLVLRTGVVQEGREDIPEQVISIPISLTVNAGKLVVEPGSIRVTSGQETNRARQITRANQIRRILGRKIIRRELDTTFNLQAAGDKKLPMTLTLIQLSDGWVTAELQ